MTLYSLHTLGGCGNLQLISFMVENDIMNYFDLQTALGDLRDTGQAVRTPMEADYLYQITPAGRRRCACFAPRAGQPAQAGGCRRACFPASAFTASGRCSARIVHDEATSTMFPCRWWSSACR